MIDIEEIESHLEMTLAPTTMEGSAAAHIFKKGPMPVEDA